MNLISFRSIPFAILFRVASGPVNDNTRWLRTKLMFSLKYKTGNGTTNGFDTIIKEIQSGWVLVMFYVEYKRLWPSIFFFCTVVKTIKSRKFPFVSVLAIRKHLSVLLEVLFSLTSETQMTVRLHEGTKLRWGSNTFYIERSQKYGYAYLDSTYVHEWRERESYGCNTKTGTFFP